MSIKVVVTSGFGNGTFNGSIANLVTKGYTIGVVLSAWTVQSDSTTAWSAVADETTVWTEQTDQATTWAEA